MYENKRMNELNFKISVVIPIYNALDDLKICIKSIINNYDFSIGEIILINDYSDKETADYLKKLVIKYPKFKLEENSQNLGFIKTCNKGIALASGEIVVLLNSDTKIPSGFCQRIIECFDSDNSIGVASPIASHSWLFNINLPVGYSVEKMNKLLVERHVPTYPILPAAEGFCFCIRKQICDNLGGLDEIFGKGYHEEVDFSYRAIKNGYKVVLIDNLYVYHKRNASFGKNRSKLIKQNNSVFKDRWKDFREKYEKSINFVNPIYKIRKELFPIKYWLFSREKIQGEKYIVLAGIKIKLN